MTAETPGLASSDVEHGPDGAGGPSPGRGRSAVPEGHPGIPDLFAVLACVEIAAFYRLSEDARFAPTLRDRIALASLAAAEMGHFEELEAALRDRGLDVVEVMAPFASALDEYHASTTPSTWLEVLVKAYVGDGIAADFYREIAGGLPDGARETVTGVLSQTEHTDFVVHEVRTAVAASTVDKDRLMLWGRRLLGEAMTRAQYVLAQRDELTELVMYTSGDLTGVIALFDRMQQRHGERMAALGLS